MKVLIYAPDLVGHPQVYCRVIGEILLELGCKVVLAVGRSRPINVQEWPDLLPFADVSDVEFEDCSNDAGSYLSAEVIRGLQRKHHIDFTLFIEGDKTREEFCRIASGAAEPLLGRNFGIFARTSSWYPGEEFYSGAPLPVFDPTIRGNLSKIKRLLLRRKQSDRYFYEVVLLRKRVLTGVLVKDERVAERFGEPVYWMPEMFRPFWATEGDQDQSEFNAVFERYLEFKSRNLGREPLLFFGTGSWYRGYDIFLKLLEMAPGAYGIHAGDEFRDKPAKPYRYDVASLRAELRKQGRLFETNGYVRSQRLIDAFFEEIRFGVSTHRLTGSSGTVLHALWTGKPVIVPDSGLLGYQNKKWHLGLTYEYGDVFDLAQTWASSRRASPEQYTDDIARFMARFTRDNMTSFYRRLLNAEVS